MHLYDMYVLGFTLDCDWTGDKGEKGISMKFVKCPDITKDDRSANAVAVVNTPSAAAAHTHSI
eukprot:COSAG05_NODE_4350_length_1556_cov_0.897049_2_plen_63_part_00